MLEWKRRKVDISREQVYYIVTFCIYTSILDISSLKVVNHSRFGPPSAQWSQKPCRNLGRRGVSQVFEHPGSLTFPDAFFLFLGLSHC